MRLGQFGRVFAAVLVAVMGLGALPARAFADADAAPIVQSTVTPSSATEPQTVVASATFTDPDSTSWTCTINYGDNTFVPGVVSGNACTGPAHRYAASGTYIGFVGITDDQGQSGAWMFTATYTNVAPTLVDAAVTWTGSGKNVVASVGISDPGLGTETYQCVSADYGDGSAPQVGVYHDATGYADGLPHCIFPEHQYATTGTYQVVMKVADQGGAQASKSVSVPVGALSPTLSAVADQSLHVVSGGWHLHASTTLSDPNAIPTGPYTVDITWGDGTTSQLQQSGPGVISLRHDYVFSSQQSPFTVSVKATASTGTYATLQFRVTTLYDGLLIVPTSVVTVANEGTPATLSWFVWDPQAASYQVAVSWGDGTSDSFTSSAAMLNLTHTYRAGDRAPDFPGTLFSATMTVTDSFGSVSGTNQAMILDVPPVVTAPHEINVPEGVTQDITVATFNDPSVGPWTVDVSIGGWSRQFSMSAPGPITIPYDGDYGSRLLQVTVVDRGGASSMAFVSVVVTNESPTVGPVTVVGQGGQTALASATFSDAAMAEPTTTETYTCKVGYGDGTGTQTGTISVDQRTCTGPAHTYPTPGSYSVTVIVDDSNGGRGVSSATYVYLPPDQPPVVAPWASSVTVREPDAVQPTANFTDADSTSWTCDIDYGDGTKQAGVVAGQTCTSPAHNYVASGVYTGSITVTDSQGSSGQAPFTVRYTNTAPSVGGLGLVGDVRANHLSHAVAAVVDPGSAFETYTCTSIDYGDGSPLQAGTWVPNGWSDGLPRCVFPDHAYPSAGDYTLTAIVKDGGGLSGTASFRETIDVALAVIPGPFQPTPNEGTSAQFTWMVADSTPNYPYSVHVDWAEGTSEDLIISSRTITLSHTYVASDTYPGGGNGTVYWAAMTVTDAAGNVGIGFNPIFVVDLAPAIQPSAAITIDEGSNEVRTLGSFTDVSIAPWKVEIYCGTNCGSTQTVPTPGPISYLYDSAGGSRTFTISVTDRTGLKSSATVPVTVRNVAPVVSVGQVPSTAGIGSTVAAAFTFTDPGLGGSESYSCSVNFGDGSGAVTGQLSGSTCTASHAYQIAGQYSIVATVTDSNGGGGSASASTKVSDPAKPKIGTVLAPASTLIGTPVIAAASYTPSGLSPADTCDVDYGDGSALLAGFVNGTWCVGAGHTYGTAGTYVITVTIRAANGQYAAATASIVVGGLLGSIALSGNLVEGSTVTASASFKTVGSQTWTCKVDYGDGSGALKGTVSGTTCKGPGHKYSHPGDFTVTVTLAGSKGVTDSASKLVTMADIHPVVTVSTSAAFVKVGSPVTATVKFTYSGPSTSFTGVVNWCDGTQSVVSLSGSARQFTVTHTYTTDGFRLVEANVSDYGQLFGEWVRVAGSPSTNGYSLVSFDPARSISGSGTLAVPARSCSLNAVCKAASTANVSLAISYPKNATKPTGTLTDAFNGFSLSATGFDYLVLDGDRLTGHGTAKVNGVSGFTFLFFEVEGNPDTLWLEVFDSKGNNCLYTYQPLSSGSFTVK